MINRWFCHQLFRWLRCFASNTCHSHAAKWRPTDTHTHARTSIEKPQFIAICFRLQKSFLWISYFGCIIIFCCCCWLAPFVCQFLFTLTQPFSRSHSLELFNFASVVRRPFPILFWIKAFNYWKHLFWIFQLNVSLFIFPLLFISPRSLCCFDSVEINRLWVSYVSWSWIDVLVCLFNSTHQPKPFSFNLCVHVCCGFYCQCVVVWIRFLFLILTLSPTANKLI